MQETFDSSGVRLQSIHLENVAGSIYVCLADERPHFDEFRDGLTPLLAPHHLADAKLAHESTLVERANWKLVMENARERYHCAARHPGLSVPFPVRRGSRLAESQIIQRFEARMVAVGLPVGPVEGEWWQASRFPLNDDCISLTGDGKPCVSKPMCELAGGDVGSLRWALEPHSFCHALGDYLVMFSAMPTGPQETIVTCKWFVHKDAVEGVDYTVDGLTNFWNETNLQDRDLAENNQRGVNGRGYRPGPYSEEAEQLVVRLVDWYCAKARSYLDNGAGETRRRSHGHVMRSSPGLHDAATQLEEVSDKAAQLTEVFKDPRKAAYLNREGADKPLRSPISFDTLKRARAYRKQRIKDQLRTRDCAAILLYDPVNIRYALDVSNMQLWMAHNPSHYALVFADGPAIDFEYRTSEHLGKDIETIDEVRTVKSWYYFAAGEHVAERAKAWAAEIADLVREYGGGNKRLAIDKCEPLGMHALASHGIVFVEGQELTEHARSIKSPDGSNSSNGRSGSEKPGWRACTDSHPFPAKPKLEYPGSSSIMRTFARAANGSNAGSSPPVRAPILGSRNARIVWPSSATSAPSTPT